MELKDYDMAIRYGELTLSFCLDEYVSDVHTIKEYVIEKAWTLKESEGK